MDRGFDVSLECRSGVANPSLKMDVRFEIPLGLDQMISVRSNDGSTDLGTISMVAESDADLLDQRHCQTNAI